MSATARNVLLIVADQWRHDRSGFGGTPSVPTPHCDALAAAGRLRTHAFCAYPVCTPSRYSMMNGLYARQHLGLGNTATPRTDVETWPDVLRSAGFDTCAVGKMHYLPTRLDLGFDRMILAEQHGDGRFGDDYHGELLERGLVDRLDLTDQREEYRAEADAAYHQSFGAAASALPEGLHSTDWIGDRAEREIAGWTGDTRHALMVSFIKPHHPFDPPQAWLDRCESAATEVPADWTDGLDPRDLALHGGHFPHGNLTREKLREVARHYDATIRHLDERIGRILAKLHEVGRAEDTLVVLTSDHGEYLGSHHLLLKQNTMYEALVRVPMILRGPGVEPGVDDGLGSLLDLPATVLKATGSDAAIGLDDAIDLRVEASRPEIFCEFGGAVMVRTTRHKLIWHDRPEGRRLYDLAADPLERSDVYEEPAAATVRRGLEGTLFRWLNTGCRPPMLPVPAEPDTRDRERRTREVFDSGP